MEYLQADEPGRGRRFRNNPEVDTDHYAQEYQRNPERQKDPVEFCTKLDADKEKTDTDEKRTDELEEKSHIPLFMKV